MKPTRVLNRELKLALGNIAVPELKESPAPWMETAAPRAGTSRAECSCWMLDMDTGPQPSRSPWESSWARPAQHRETAWRQTIQISCLEAFRLLFSLDGMLAWK